MATGNAAGGGLSKEEDGALRAVALAHSSALVATTSLEPALKDYEEVVELLNQASQTLTEIPSFDSDADQFAFDQMKATLESKRLRFERGMTELRSKSNTKGFLARQRDRLRKRKDQNAVTEDSQEAFHDLFAERPPPSRYLNLSDINDAQKYCVDTLGSCLTYTKLQRIQSTIRCSGYAIVENSELSSGEYLNRGLYVPAEVFGEGATGIRIKGYHTKLEEFNFIGQCFQNVTSALGRSPLRFDNRTESMERALETIHELNGDLKLVQVRLHRIFPGRVTKKWGGKTRKRKKQNEESCHIENTAQELNSPNQGSPGERHGNATEHQRLRKDNEDSDDDDDDDDGDDDGDDGDDNYNTVQDNGTIDHEEQRQQNPFVEPQSGDSDSRSWAPSLARSATSMVGSAMDSGLGGLRSVAGITGVALLRARHSLSTEKLTTQQVKNWVIAVDTMCSNASIVEHLALRLDLSNSEEADSAGISSTRMMHEQLRRALSFTTKFLEHVLMPLLLWDIETFIEFYMNRMLTRFLYESWDQPQQQSLLSPQQEPDGQSLLGIQASMTEALTGTTTLLSETVTSMMMEAESGDNATLNATCSDFSNGADAELTFLSGDLLGV